MFEKSDVDDLFKLVRMGMLKLGEKDGLGAHEVYGLEEWERAWDRAAELGEFGAGVLIKPWFGGSSLRKDMSHSCIL